jgi:hypothetical protein
VVCAGALVDAASGLLIWCATVLLLLLLLLPSTVTGHTLVAVEVLCSLREPHSHYAIFCFKQRHQHCCKLAADWLVLLLWYAA